YFHPSSRAAAHGPLSSSPPVPCPLARSSFSFPCSPDRRDLHSFPTRRSSDLAFRLLTVLYEQQREVFWPDAISYRDADLDHVVGHRQTTDAYLASLAARNNASLATFDEALAAVRPDVVTLIP